MIAMTVRNGAAGPIRSTSGQVPAAVTDISGLSSDDALRLLQQFGPNSTPDTSVHLIRSALRKFWAPVPWMLEAVIVIELFLHNEVEAVVIAVLLVFNAALSFFQESRAQATLTALK
jgi:H+-transporting ATPase